jgi:hypothetical protein
VCIGTEVLFSDIGNVVIDRKNGGGEPSFSKGDHRMSPAIPGAIEGLGELRKARFGPMTYMLSRVGHEYAVKTHQWNVANHFYDLTGITVQRVLFCKEKTDKVEYYIEKQATHVIDDRVENLQHVLDRIRDGAPLHPKIQLILFCGNGHRNDPHYGTELLVHQNVRRVYSWEECVRALTVRL